jgi:hypothetical protein
MNANAFEDPKGMTGKRNNSKMVRSPGLERPG